MGRTAAWLRGKLGRGAAVPAVSTDSRCAGPHAAASKSSTPDLLLVLGDSAVAIRCNFSRATAYGEAAEDHLPGH